MNLMNSLLQSATTLTPVERIGWVLMHSLWQQSLVAIAVWLVMMLLRRRSAHARYSAACAAMAVMAALPVTTAVLAFRPGHIPARSFTHPTIHTLTQSVAAPSPSIGMADPGVELSAVLFRSASWAWMIGLSCFSLWNLLGWLKIHQLRRSARPAAPPWPRRLAELAQKVGAASRTSIAISEGVVAPAVIGWLRPLVLVPISALTELPAAQLEALLLHELAHVRRHDYLINLIQTAIETIFFYHPAIWWVGARIRAERENCCDDIAVRHCASTTMYVQALAAMEEIRVGPFTRLAIGSTGSGLLKRVERLLGRPSRPMKRRPSALVGTMGLLLSTAVVLAPHSTVSYAGPPKAATAPAETSKSPALDTVHPDDLEPSKPADYRISPNDLLDITISDLNGPNTETRKAARVSQSGNISMPYLKDPIRAAGQTEIELEQSIIKGYRDARLIEHANISVTIVEARGSMFSIAGAVNRPGQFQILQSDFRLLNAISLAGGTTGNLLSIRVLRRSADGQTVRTIDVPPAALLSGDTNLNLLIRSNDQIVITGKGEPPPPPAVRLAIGQDSLLFEGKKVTWADLERLLQNLPNRDTTVLELVPASSDITIGKFLDAQRRAGELVNKLGLKHLQPLMTETGQ